MYALSGNRRRHTINTSAKCVAACVDARTADGDGQSRLWAGNRLQHEADGAGGDGSGFLRNGGAQRGECEEAGEELELHVEGVEAEGIFGDKFLFVYWGRRRGESWSGKDSDWYIKKARIWTAGSGLEYLPWNR